jgi:hypothetical protein
VSGQPRQSLRTHGWNTGNRIRVEPDRAIFVSGYTPQLTAALRDEQATVGQEGHPPGMIETARNDDDTYVLTLGCLILDRLQRQGRNGNTARRNRNVAAKRHALLSNKRCRGR